MTVLTVRLLKQLIFFKKIGGAEVHLNPCSRMAPSPITSYVVLGMLYNVPLSTLLVSMSNLKTIFF